MNTDLTPLLARPGAVIAVVGATDSPYKYGAIIYRDLKSRGFEAVAVNPARQTVNGDPAYPDLASLPEPPTLINLVVPPSTTMETIRQAAVLGLDNLWFQPGSFDDQVIDQVRRLGLTYQAGACIMVRARTVGL